VRGPLGPAPAKALINSGAILNNASYNLAGTSVAPGSIAAIFGTGLTNGALCLSTDGCSPRYFGGKMGTSMGGTSVTVNGIPAPIFYATPTQLGIQIPAELPGPSATVLINADGQTSVPETVALEPAAPGIFSTTGDGRGVGSITHANGALVTAVNPAVRGETLVLYATGLGVLTPSVATGNIATSASQLATKPVVTLGGVPATVAFAGQSGCCVGLNQINFSVPAGAPTGNAVAVVVSVGAKASNSVTIAVQ